MYRISAVGVLDKVANVFVAANEPLAISFEVKVKGFAKSATVLLPYTCTLPLVTSIDPNITAFVDTVTTPETGITAYVVAVLDTKKLPDTGTLPEKKTDPVAPVNGKLPENGILPLTDMELSGRVVGLSIPITTPTFPVRGNVPPEPTLPLKLRVFPVPVLNVTVLPVTTLKVSVFALV